MKYTTLGHSGLKVSRVCFGCMSMGDKNDFFGWVVDEDEGKRLVRLALESGVNFFDTANMYSMGSSEEHLGRALKEYANRDEVVIATKGFFNWEQGPNTNGLSRKALMQQLDGSLKRLGTDYVDLYQIHRFDEDTPVEETMETLHDMVKAGKVRYIGASSMMAWQFLKMQHVADANGWTRFVSMQNQVSLLYREEEREMLPLCYEENVGVIPWSPLARGLLTRDRGADSTRSQTDFFAKRVYANLQPHEREIMLAQDDKVIAALHQLADERGLPRAQLALAWLYAKPEVTAPIIGVAKENHLTDAVAAVDVALSDEEIARLEEHYISHPVHVTGSDIRPRWEFTMTVKS